MPTTQPEGLRYMVNATMVLARRLIAVLPICLGLAILIGGPHRFTSPGLKVPAEIAPWWVWGVLFVAAGGWLFSVTNKTTYRSFWPGLACSMMFGVWAIALLLSSFQNGFTAFIGFAVYGWASVTFAATAARGLETNQSPIIPVQVVHQKLHLDVRQVNDIPRSRQPDTFFLYLLCMLSGLVTAAGQSPPQSVDRLVGHAVAVCWGAALVFFGSFGLLAMLHKDFITRILLDRVTRLGLAGACTAYTVAVASLGSFNGFFAASLVGCFGLTSLIRAVQITRWVNRNRQAAR